MPAPRKPKKVFIQFAIAAVIAVILAAGAIVGGITLVTGAFSQAQQTQQDVAKEKAKLEAEKQRLLEEKENLQKAPKTYKLVQAAADLSPGQPITQEMLTLVTTEDRPPAGTLNRLSDAIGKVVRVSILKGESVDAGKLLDAGYLSVQPGKRAITIQVDAVGGLNGALIAGAHVDILTTTKSESNPVTRTLLQNVPVLSVGNSDDGGGSKVSSQQQNGIPITVSVTPQQAELLTLANLAGTFHLTLRNYNDSNLPKMAGADITALMTDVPMGGLGKALPSAPHLPPMSANSGFHNVNFSPEAGNLPAPDSGGPAGSRFSMQIYRGTGSETVDFQQ